MTRAEQTIRSLDGTVIQLSSGNLCLIRLILHHQVEGDHWRVAQSLSWKTQPTEEDHREAEFAMRAVLEAAGFIQTTITRLAQTARGERVARQLVAHGIGGDPHDN
jgi:hypothetical protein